MAIVKVLSHRRRHPNSSPLGLRALAALRHLLEAGYLADVLFGQAATHLHAHFASSPALVALLTSRITGLPYTLTAHAKDIYVSHPDDLRAKFREARAVVTCTEYNRQHLLSRYPRERSEEHTSELQSRLHLVCRLLLEKKKKQQQNTYTTSH